MFIIDFRNKNVSEYRFSVMNNSNVDIIHFYSHFTQYAVGTSIYLKVKSVDETYIDKIAIASENVSIDDGALLCKWLMGAVSTQCKKIGLQLQFEQGESIVAQTGIVYLTLADTIDVSHEIEPIYPDVLKHLQEQIDEEHNTNQTQQEEIDNNTNKLSTIESGAEVNVIESVVVNGTPLVPTDKTVSFDVPTKTSDLTNDSDFTTKLYVDEQIEEIEQRSDVVDVVGTYADLQAYDTSSLAPNSLIKVINDETHDHEITYYRWVITAGVGAWVYVASEGAYYTTTQIDTMLLGYYAKNFNLIPSANNTYDIGSSSYTFKDLYLSGKVYVDYVLGKTNDAYGLNIGNGWVAVIGNLLPNTTNARGLGSSSNKWKDLYLQGSLYGATYNFTIDNAYGILYGRYYSSSSQTQLGFEKIEVISFYTDRTFTLETAPTGCYPEYKALITNSGVNAIVLTFTGVNHILCNDDNCLVNANTITIPSGTTIECSCVNNNLVAINFEAN